MSPDDPRHGAPGRAGYDAHRVDGEDACQPCRDAAARYERARKLDQLSSRPRMTPGIGSRRRMQALVALGHTFGRLGPALGMTQSGASSFTHSTAELVRTPTALKVLALYDAWSMTLPPSVTPIDRKNAAYARNVARRNGWAPPLAWEGLDIDDPNTQPYSCHTHQPDPDDLDPVVVERILTGDTTIAATATRAERIAVATTWTRRTGRSLADLERTTGWKPERYTARPNTTHTKENTAA